MHSKFIIPLMALVGLSQAFSSYIDHTGVMTTTERADSGYSIEAFNALVDAVLTDGCDDNGCDVAAQKCNDVHCISVDGDNLNGDTSNIVPTVSQYIKQSMNATESGIDNCGSSGCVFIPAHTYNIPQSISLKRYNDDGSVNVLYKINIVIEETLDACEAVFMALSGATAGLDGNSILGAFQIAACM